MEYSTLNKQKLSEEQAKQHAKSVNNQSFWQNQISGQSRQPKFDLARIDRAKHKARALKVKADSPRTLLLGDEQQGVLASEVSVVSGRYSSQVQSKRGASVFDDLTSPVYDQMGNR